LEQIDFYYFQIPNSLYIKKRAMTFIIE